MKFGIVVFNGTTGHEDVKYVLEDILEQQVVMVWHKDNSYKSIDMLIIPSGTGYEKYNFDGTEKTSPILNEITHFSDRGGVVFGIGEGFQLLCNLGLLPGALLPNKDAKYISKNVFVKPETNATALTTLLDTTKSLKMPISSANGRYYADEEQIKEMRKNKQILFRYCNKDARLKEDANPNGSLENIAGVCNVKKNVFGILPHPERCSDDEIGNTDGRIIFESLIKSINN